MKSFSLEYQSLEQLKSCIEENLTEYYNDVLVQIFTGVIDPQYLRAISEQVKAILPPAKIIGVTTAGEIHNGELCNNTTIICISAFQQTQVSIHYLEDPRFEPCYAFADAFVTEHTKAMICFTEYFSFDPVNLFKAIYKINKWTKVSGGSAGDNGLLEQTYVLVGNDVYDKGAVVCALHSEVLQASANMTLNWIAVGREMTVTKCSDNVVYELNGQPVQEVYRYYLGENITQGWPCDFPLIKVENNVEIGRSFVGFCDDNSMVYAGRLDEGDKVRFSVSNADETELYARQLQAEVNKSPVETIFIYASLGRKTSIGKGINAEFRALQQLAPTQGFFCLSEFYSTGTSNQVLNNATTVLSLCEDENKKTIPLCCEPEMVSSQSKMRSLTSLVNMTQMELHENILLLEYAQEKLIESEKMASLGARVAGVSHEINTPVGVALTGVSQLTMEINRLKDLYESRKLSEDALQRFFSVTVESVTAVNNSLKHAVKLVNSFKSISVDQHSGEVRDFNLRRYVDEIFISFKGELKTKNVGFNNLVPADIALRASPGIFAQIFSNLIMNAIHHAFDGSIGNNEITIRAERTAVLKVHFIDNGKGVDKTHINNIFDPFFTTARGQGGSGLGLNIVYNLVTQRLNGNIEVVEGQQTGFHLKITLNGA